MIVTEKMAREAWSLLLFTYNNFKPETHEDFVELTSPMVNEAYRLAARKVHPDAGGSDEAFVAVDRAKHVLLEWLEKKPKEVEPPHGEKCPKCEGRGFVNHQRAWKSMRVQCPMCRGAGELGVEREKGLGD